MLLSQPRTPKWTWLFCLKSRHWLVSVYCECRYVASPLWITEVYMHFCNVWTINKPLLPAATMDMPATSLKHPAFLPLNNEARQPTTRVGSISLPHVLHSAAPSPTPKKKKRRPRCHYNFIHYIGYFTPNIMPRQLHWGDWAIGTATQAYAHCTLLSGVQGNFLISILYLCYHTLPENHSHSDLSTVQRVSTYFIGLDKGKQNYWSQSSTITVLDESSQSS